MQIDAPAKLNLTLRVDPLRTDGFHEIESLVVQIDLCDQLTFARRRDAQIRLSADDPALRTGERNLVVRAARALQRAADEQCRSARRRTGGSAIGADIRLTKRIPAGAGLGGGSSDAAAALQALNELWGLDLWTSELIEIAAELGSDVPLFLSGSPCSIRGRGERVADVPLVLDAWIVLVLPAIHCATADVYAAFNRLPQPPERPALETILLALRSVHRGSDPPEKVSAARIAPLLFNDLEPAAFELHPPLADLARRFAALVERDVYMTGSGSGLFYLTDEERDARAVADAARAALGVRVEVARTKT